MTIFKAAPVGVFVSGGLTSWVVCKYLKNQGADVVAFWADVGQYDEPHLESFFDDLDEMGIELVRLDLKPEVARFALEILSFGGHYEGQYWNSTSGLRYLLIKDISEAMRAHGCRIFSHGCVGGGNDEKRFTNYGWNFMPDIDQYVPWNESSFASRFSSRQKMVDYVRNAGNASFIDSKVDQSTDSSLLGTSYEGTHIEDLETDFTAAHPLMSRKPWEASDQAETVTVNYHKGIATGIDGQDRENLDILRYANEVAGRHGVSIKTVFENRIQGTKCRGIYESPGMDLLYQGLIALQQLTLTKEQRVAYRDLAEKIGASIYTGQYHTSQCRRWRQQIRSLCAHLNGTISMKLYKGNVYWAAIRNVDQSVTSCQQRRFASGGHVWDKPEIVRQQALAT